MEEILSMPYCKDSDPKLKSTNLHMLDLDLSSYWIPRPLHPDSDLVPAGSGSLFKLL